MLLPKRIWKDIPGYEGLYQVSKRHMDLSGNTRRTANKQFFFIVL